MALPSEYTFGKVVTRIVQAVADGSDEDRFPDMLAAGGTVTFKPKEKNRKTVNYSALVLNQNIKGSLYVPDPKLPKEFHTYPPGTLVDSQGNKGVWLVTGNYIAEFQLYDGSFGPLEFTVTEANHAKNPLDLIHASPTEPPQGVIMVQADIPPGGGPNQTLVREESGDLAWRDFFDEEFREEFISYRDQAQEAFEKFTWPVQVQDTPPENTDVIWVNPDEPAGTTSDYARLAEEMYEASKALGITVDNSVGTRVFVGDTMIHGGTGWRDIRDLLHEDWKIGAISGRFQMQRENNLVTLAVRIQRAEGSAPTTIASTLPLLNNDGSRLPYGFSPAHIYGNFGVVSFKREYWGELVGPTWGSDLNLRYRGAPSSVRWEPGDYLNFQVSWTTHQAWPTSLPGNPA